MHGVFSWLWIWEETLTPDAALSSDRVELAVFLELDLWPGPERGWLGGGSQPLVPCCADGCAKEWIEALQLGERQSCFWNLTVALGLQGRGWLKV